MKEKKLRGVPAVFLLLYAVWLVGPDLWNSQPSEPEPEPSPAKTTQKPPKAAPRRAWSKDELLAYLAKSGGKLPQYQDLNGGTIPEVVYLSAAEECKDDRLASQLLELADPFSKRPFTGLASEGVASKEIRELPDFFPRYQAQLRRFLSSKELEVQCLALRLLRRNSWALPKGSLHSNVLALVSSKDHVIRARALDCLLEADHRVKDPGNFALLAGALQDSNAFIASRAALALNKTHPNFGPSQNPADISNPKLMELAEAGLESPHPVVRAYSAQLFDRRQGLDFMITPLLEDAEPSVRAGAAVTLTNNKRGLSDDLLLQMIAERPTESATVVLKAPDDYQTGTEEKSSSFRPGAHDTLLGTYVAVFRDRYPDFVPSSTNPQEQAQELSNWWNMDDSEDVE